MNKTPSPISGWLGATLGIALFLVGYSGWNLSLRQASAREAELAYADCQRVVTRIQSLQAKPKRALFAAGNNRAINDVLGEAFQRAGIEPTLVRGIAPSPAQRLAADAPYLRQETLVQLGSVPTEQFIRFLYALHEIDPALDISRIALTAPSRSNEAWEGDRWGAEVSLTQFVYAPIRAKDEGGRMKDE